MDAEKKLLLAYGITQAASTREAIYALSDIGLHMHERSAYAVVETLASLVGTWRLEYSLTCTVSATDLVSEARAYLTEHVVELDAMIAERMPHGIAP